MATWKTLAMSFSTAYDPNSLEGLPGVTLEVHFEQDDALGAIDGNDGLTAESLRADIELNLRMAGIPRLEQDPSTEAPSVPVLSVAVSMVEVADLGGVHAFGLTLGLSQVVTLPSGLQANLQTWNRGHVGFAASPRVRTLVREQVKEKTKAFVDAWLMVNRD